MRTIAISGSLRKGSYNTALLRAAQKLAQELGIEVLDISALPLYNEDLEENFPTAAAEARETVRAADAILIATPEFNRTPPGPLKNFFDWTSRPDTSAWKGKPIGVLGASSGPRGASFAQYDIRRIMSYFDARAMGQPEFYLGLAQEKFDASLALTDEKTIAMLRKFLAAFSAHATAARTAS